jgi:hypothetical protein
MKFCKKCNKLKDLSCFYSHPHTKDGSRNSCKECDILYKKNIGRNKQLKKRYGIDVVVYEKIFTDQEGRCAICNKKQPANKPLLHVDHCHKTNKVRGLLCYNCNMGIGRFKDDIDILKSAISYLMRFND